MIPLRVEKFSFESSSFEIILFTVDDPTDRQFRATNVRTTVFETNLSDYCSRIFKSENTRLLFSSFHPNLHKLYDYPCLTSLLFVINIEDDSGPYRPLGLVHDVPTASVSRIVDLRII